MKNLRYRKIAATLCFNGLKISKSCDSCEIHLASDYSQCYRSVGQQRGSACRKMRALWPTCERCPVQLEPAFQRSECRLLQSEASRRYRVESRARHPLPADIRDVSYYCKRQLDRAGQTLKNSRQTPWLDWPGCDAAGREAETRRRQRCGSCIFWGATPSSKYMFCRPSIGTKPA